MAYVSVTMDKIDSIIEFMHNDKEMFYFTTDGATIGLKNEPVTLNVDGTKVKVKTVDIIKALKDMLDSGEFWLDQIDDIVSGIEFDRANLREALEARRNPEVYSGL